MFASRCLRLFMVLAGFVVFSSLVATPAAHAVAVEPTYTLTPTAKPLFQTPSLAHVLQEATPACQRNLTSATPPTLQVVYTALDSNGVTISNPNATSTVNMPKLPYTVTYQAVITNTGATDMTQPTTFSTTFTDIVSFELYFEGGFGKAPKATVHKVNALKAGASQTFTFTHTYTSGAASVFYGAIDPFCQQDVSHPPVNGVILLLLAPTADIVPIIVAPEILSGPVPPAFSLVSTDTFEVGVALANYGQLAPSHDLSVRFVSPLIGKPVTATVPVAELPAPGGDAGYIVGDSNPIVFTAKTVTKPATASIAATVSLPPGDTSKAKSRKTAFKVMIRPQGTDVGVSYLYTNDCPIFVGMSENITIDITNYGSIDMPAGTTIQIYVDGKPSGAPIAIAAVAAGSGTTITPAPTVTFTKAGKHTISVAITPNKSVPDYYAANNKMTITRYVLPV